MEADMAREKCPRCGHELTRKKYAREATPHTKGPRLDDDTNCGGCRDCYLKRSRGE
jgi:uncharacterized protein with PIN domain